MSQQPEPAWKFGCQARPWLQTLGQPEFARRLPQVMKEIASIGFAGFETALACLPLDDPAAFTVSRDEANGIELAATHTGGAWWDPDQAASVPDLLQQIAKLPAFGCHRLMLSIGRGVTAVDAQALEKMTATLWTLATGAGQYGVEVAIHNHDHELADDARVLRTVLEGASGSGIRLGADLGWVAHAGWDPVRFIHTFGEFLSYLHVRDLDAANRFVEVGRGVLDWPGIISALDGVGYTGWLVAESEFTDAWDGLAEPETTARAQFEGMTERLQSFP